MTIDQIRKVCVCGAGLMGKEIALNTAMYGYDVWLYDSINQVLPRAKEWAVEYLDRQVAKGRFTEAEKEDILSRFHTTEDLYKAAQNADLVIEAIIEKQDIKETLFKNLNDMVREGTILATNSSFMPSSMFIGCCKNPGRLANLHYFNPATRMKLVEVVKGEHTDDSTAEILMEFSRRTGKNPILLRQEIEGFIVNRFYLQSTLIGLELLSKGIASVEDIDTALETGLNHPIGLFKLMDFTGIDLTYHILCNMKAKGMECPGFELVEEKYKAGELGRKTGRGWYDYRKKGVVNE